MYVGSSESIIDRPCPGTIKVNEGKADLETLGVVRWNQCSREQEKPRFTWRE
jgi:hypothetical protein